MVAIYAVNTFLPSPSLPLLPPRSSLAAFAADYAARSPDLSSSKPTDWARVVWSVAEDVCHMPRIEKPTDKIKGDGIHMEKTLFDALLPFNATISTLLAFLTAAAAELQRSGKINDLVAAAEEEEENREASLPWEWDRVGHDTTVNMTKDVLGQTLTRFVEITAKPRLSRLAYCELLKHPHKAAMKAYRTSASRVDVSKVVLHSTTFYALRSTTMWIADVFVDAVAWSRGQMSSSCLGSNIALKAAKYLLSGGLCFLLGVALPPFIYPHPYMFLAVEQLVANLTADALVNTLGTIEPS
jgi:hypothetical protein